MIISSLFDELLESQVEEINLHFKNSRNSLPPIFIVTPFDMNKETSTWTTEKPNMQQLCRIVLLARQSLQSLRKLILSFESSESFKVFA